MKSYLTYGVPLGSALIIAAFLTTVVAYIATSSLTEQVFTWTFHSGSGGTTTTVTSNYVVDTNLFLRCAELIIQIGVLWYGVIGLGLKSCLVLWILLESVFLIIWGTQIIWAMVKFGSYYSSTSMLASLFILLCVVIRYAYPINLGLHCLSKMAAINTDLQPLGKGLKHAFGYYKSNVEDGARLMLMMEVVLNLYYLLEEQVAMSGRYYQFTDSGNTAHDVEDFIHYARFVLCIVGFWIVQKDKRSWMFTWCFFYFTTLVVSIAIFFYLTFAWRFLRFLPIANFFLTSIANLIYRGTVLLACFRYSGYAATNRFCV